MFSPDKENNRNKREEYTVCPQCRMSVGVYVPDCPNCGYFIWGDDDSEDEFYGFSNSGGGEIYDDDDKLTDKIERYYDYNLGDFEDFEDDRWNEREDDDDEE